MANACESDWRRLGKRLRRRRLQNSCTPPPPFVQAMVNDQKEIDGTHAYCCLDKTGRCLRAALHMVQVTLCLVTVNGGGGGGCRTDDETDILQRGTLMGYALLITLILYCQIIVTFGGGGQRQYWTVDCV